MGRIRSIKPGFFKDPTMAALSPGCQVFYIGLWTIADDAGWLEWCIPWIGAELFPYAPVRKRERDIHLWEQQLAEAGRLKVGECGHATIPRFRDHQHLAGPTRRVETYFEQHKNGDCPSIPAETRGNPPQSEEIHGV